VTHKDGAAARAGGCRDWQNDDARVPSGLVGLGRRSAGADLVVDVHAAGSAGDAGAHADLARVERGGSDRWWDVPFGRLPVDRDARGCAGVATSVRRTGRIGCSRPARSAARGAGTGRGPEAVPAQGHERRWLRRPSVRASVERRGCQTANKHCQGLRTALGGPPRRGGEATRFTKASHRCSSTQGLLSVKRVLRDGLTAADRWRPRERSAEPWQRSNPHFLLGLQPAVAEGAVPAALDCWVVAVDHPDRRQADCCPAPARVVLLLSSPAFVDVVTRSAAEIVLALTKGGADFFTRVRLRRWTSRR
jgi:hypothetical protein